MSDNKIHTLGRIDQAIRGINGDGTDDGYIPPQSENGALERIEKSIKAIDIKGIKSGLPKVTNADNGKVLQVKNGKWGKGEHAINVTAEEFEENYSNYKNKNTIIFVNGPVAIEERLNEIVDSEEAAAGKVILNPEWNYVSGDKDYNGWHAFHDEDATGWCTMYPYNDTVFTSRNNLGYLEYTFGEPKLISEISVGLQEYCAAHQSAQCEISWDYTVDGEQWLDPSVTGIADTNYIFAQSVDTDTHSFEDYVDATVNITPTEILAIRFKNTYAMCTNNGGANDDYVFALKNIIFKSVVTNESDASIWYKGVCYENTNIPVAEPTPRGPIPLKLVYADGGDSYNNDVSYGGSYTATEHCYVLAFCQIVNGQNADGGADLTNSISISSSEEPLYSDYKYLSAGTSSNREHSTRLELYEMDKDDILSFSVGLNSDFMFKNRQDYMFLAFIVDDYYVNNIITQLECHNDEFALCVDDTFVNSANKTVSGSGNKDYFVLSFEYEATTNANNSVKSQFEIIGNAYCDSRYICGKDTLIERRTRNAVSISAGFVKGEGDYTLNCYFGSGNSYFSKGYAIYRLN